MFSIDWLSSLRSQSSAKAAGAVASRTRQMGRRKRRMWNLRSFRRDCTIPAASESRNAAPPGWRIFDMPAHLRQTDIVTWLTRTTLLVYEPRKFRGALFRARLLKFGPKQTQTEQAR